eukprot:7123612-Prymnesium_polylepis.1
MIRMKEKRRVQVAIVGQRGSAILGDDPDEGEVPACRFPQPSPLTPTLTPNPNQNPNPYPEHEPEHEHSTLTKPQPEHEPLHQAEPQPHLLTLTRALLCRRPRPLPSRSWRTAT